MNILWTVGGNMFFLNNGHRVVERNHRWYVETPTGYEGPFEHEEEAIAFARLQRCADLARFEAVDLSNKI